MDWSEVFECDSPRIVAIHEAGHAVAVCVLGLTLNSVDIRPEALPDGRLRRGRVDAPYDIDAIADRGEDAAMPLLIQGLSGPIAERKVNFRYREHHGGTSDFERVRHIAIVAVCGYADSDNVPISDEQRARVNKLLNNARVAAVELVERWWVAVKKVAAELEKRQEMSGDEVAAIIGNVRPRGSRFC